MSYSYDDLKKLPLLILHTHLEKIEGEIDEQAQRNGGDTLTRWQDFRAGSDVGLLWGIDQGLRNYFGRVAEIVREKEQAEIETLKAGRAA